MCFSILFIAECGLLRSKVVGWPEVVRLQCPPTENQLSAHNNKHSPTTQQ